MDIHQIYNALIKGKTLQLPFTSKLDAEIFRVRLYKYKKARDKELLDLDLMIEADMQMLRFTLAKPTDECEQFIATAYFKAKGVNQRYEGVVILD
jgi:hypothetical protein